MNEIINTVHSVLDDKKMTAEELLQLNKICELEDSFVKEFSKEKWKEYFNLDIEKGKLHSLQSDETIMITYKLCKKLFKD